MWTFFRANIDLLEYITEKSPWPQIDSKNYISFVLFIDWVANRILFIFEELTHEKA